MKKIISIIIMTLIFGSFYFSQKNEVKAAEGTISPSLLEDTYATKVSPYNNYGSDGTLKMGYISSVDSPSVVFLKFANMNLPAGTTIQSAYLKLDTTWCDGNPNPTTFAIGLITDNWSENTLTWSNQPNGSAYVTGNTACNSGYISYSIKDLVQKWQEGRPYKGLMLKGPLGPAGWSRHYASSENPTEPKPIMVINYTTPDGVANQSSSTTSSNTGSSSSSSKSTSPVTVDPNTSASNTANNQNNANPTETSEDLERQARELTAGLRGMTPEERFGIIMIYAAPVLGILFWILVTVLIIVVVKRKKKKSHEIPATDVAPVAADPVQPVQSSPATVDTVSPVVAPEVVVPVKAQEKKSITVKQTKKKKSNT